MQVVPLEFAPDPVVIHKDPENIHVRYRAPISRKYKRCLILMGLGGTCGCCRAEQALARTYLEVHDNRVEYNYPVPTLCCVVDAVDVLYFDRDIMASVDRAGFCSPLFTHCVFFPTCCDMVGEGIVFSAECCQCQKPAAIWKARSFCCFFNHVLLCGLVSAETAVQEVKRAKYEWASKGGPPVTTMK